MRRKNGISGVVLCILMLLIGTAPNLFSDGATVQDIDGNVYGTVQIGNQVWMTENLRVTRYNDGTEIPLITDAVGWARATADGYCWYDNESANAEKQGALYNWFAVETGRLCPPGWHIPTDEDWTELTSFLEKQGLDTDALLMTGNSTGFSALPGGYRYGQYWAPPNNFTGPLFYEKGLNGYWWTSTEATGTHAWSRTLSAHSKQVLRSFFIKQTGYSVRAIKK